MKNLCKVNLRQLKTRMILLTAAVLWAGAGSAMAFEVWMGTHLMESSVATNLEDWALTASMLDGVNVNRAPHDTNPASNQDWQTILAQFDNVSNTITEMPRSGVSRNPALVDEFAFNAMEDALQQKFNVAGNFNYDIDHLLVYDNATTYQGTQYNYNWTESEVQHMRDWLDSNGHQDVALVWNARNFSQANQDWATNMLFDHVMIEASADAFLNNTNNQFTLLNWLWTNPATINKKVILQIPRSNNGMTQYAATRRVAVKVGQELGFGADGIRSDRLVFLPVTYNDNVPYLPETSSDGSLYEDTITSLALSLIEQRPLFEGYNGTPTNADADSFVRVPPQPVSPGVLIAGWDNWSVNGVHAPDVTDGMTSGTTSKSGFVRDTDQRASTDGTWGTLDTPAVDATADDNSDSVRLTNGSSGHYDFTLMNTGGADRNLLTFHFDAATYRPSSARNYELSVLSGDLTVGTVASGVVPSVTGGQQDWSDFDIPLTGLDDHTLDADGIVTFRLEFTGGTVGAGGHHQSLDNVAVTAELPRTLIVGWDNFDDAAAPTVTSSAAGVTATTVITGSGWSNNDGSGRGSSKDATWGTFESPAAPDAGTTAVGANLTLINGAASGDLTFTITNGGNADVELNSFHMDALAFRPNAARTYALNVVSGDMTIGNVFTSAEDAITHLGGNLLTDDADPLTHAQHDDIDIDMSGLVDHTLGAGETAVIHIAFSDGTGSVGGHHLFLDNVAFSGTVVGAGVLLGDVNLDGVINFLDIAPFIVVLSGGGYQAEADCDENGAVNFLDISPFIAILSGS